MLFASFDVCLVVLSTRAGPTLRAVDARHLGARVLDDLARALSATAPRGRPAPFGPGEQGVERHLGIVRPVQTVVGHGLPHLSIG